MKAAPITDARAQELKGEIVGSLSELESVKILLVGDVGLDEYLLGDVGRISPEAPVPVVDVKDEQSRVGLAANVAQNLVSLGGSCSLVGVTGDDPARRMLIDLLKNAGAATDGLVADPSRPTTRKTRVLAGHHHIVRVDFEHRSFLSAEAEKKLLQIYEAELESCSGVLLQDYAKGVFSEPLCQKLIDLAHKKGKKVAVDPHRSTPIRYYEGADLLKPNREEAFLLSGLNLDDLRTGKDSLYEVGASLQQKAKVENLVLTLGKEGMALFEPSGVTQMPTYARRVFDVTGAGDTVLASLGLAWFAGWSLEKACVFANFAAGVVVGEVGCVPCDRTSLLEYMAQH